MTTRDSSRIKKAISSFLFLVILHVIFTLFSQNAFCGYDAACFNLTDHYTKNNALLFVENEQLSEKDSKEISKKKFLRYTSLIAPPMFTIFYGIKVWDWGESRVWNWSLEKEWGYDSDSGGSDKAGHAFAGYTMARLFYNIFDYTEDGKPRKWLFSFLSSFMTSLFIEIGDAFTDKYGFSWGDLLADSVGIGIGLFLERYPKISSVLSFSFEYFPTRGFRKSDKYSIFNISTDNTGWKFLANLKLSGLRNSGIKMPEIFRYFTIDFGFFVQGYTEYDMDLGIENKRRWFIGISLNLAEVQREIFKNCGRLFKEWIPAIFTCYHAPIGVKKKFDID